MTRGNVGHTVRASKPILLEWSGSVTLRYDDARCRRRRRHRSRFFSASFCGSVKMSRERERGAQTTTRFMSTSTEAKALTPTKRGFVRERTRHSLSWALQGRISTTCGLPSFSLSSVERSVVGRSGCLTLSVL